MMLSLANTLVSARASGESYVGPLDAYESSLLSAYSVWRRLLSSYTGPLIRVRRSSDDAEQDIGAGATGLLDTVALLAFCGAGNGFLTTIYDHTETTNLVRATASIQPQIVNSGALYLLGSHPSARFNGTQSISTSANLAPTGILWTGTVDAYGGLQRIVSDGFGNSGLLEVSGLKLRYNSGLGDPTDTYSNQPTAGTAMMLDMYRSAASDSFGSANGTEDNFGTRSALQNGTAYTVGDYLSGGGQQLTGNTLDVLFFNTFLGTSDRAAVRSAMAL
jgi:hypothetical protein